jgi:UDP-glucuronate 4-epimerase
VRTQTPITHCPYAASKKAAEALCDTYHMIFDIDVTVLRYFTVYGPAGRPGMSLFRFVQWINEEHPVVIFGDGRQSRDFTFIDDVARAPLRPCDLRGMNSSISGAMNRWYCSRQSE